MARSLPSTGRMFAIRSSTDGATSGPRQPPRLPAHVDGAACAGRTLRCCASRGCRRQTSVTARSCTPASCRSPSEPDGDPPNGISALQLQKQLGTALTAALGCSPTSCPAWSPRAQLVVGPGGNRRGQPSIPDQRRSSHRSGARKMLRRHRTRGPSQCAPKSPHGAADDAGGPATCGPRRSPQCRRSPRPAWIPRSFSNLKGATSTTGWRHLHGRLAQNPPACSLFRLASRRTGAIPSKHSL